MAFFTNPGFAKNEEAPPQPFGFSCFQVKPGMELQFEKLVKDAIPVLQEMGVTQMDTFTTSNFGVSGKYLFVSPLMDPAAMDAQLSDQRSNMVPVSIVSLMSGMSQTVVGSQDFMLIPQTDLDIPLAEGYEIKLVHIVTNGTTPDNAENFKKGIKEAVKAIGKTNVKGVLVGRVGLGGNFDEYMVFNFYDSFKEFLENQPAIEKELSAADLSALDGIVNYRKSEVFVRLPELCMQPAAK